MGEILGEAHGAATIGAWTSRCSTRRSPSSDQPAFRARQVWRWTANGARRLRRDDRPPGARCGPRWPSACRSRRSSSSTRRTRRDGTVKALFRTARRPPGRGRADALPRRAPLGLRLLAVGLPAHLHVLRHRDDEVRPQPDRDARSSTRSLHFRRIEPVDHLVFMGMGEPLMNLDDVLDAAAPAARRRHHAPPHRRLDGRLGAGDPAADRDRHAAAARALAARARRRAALADHAGQRPLPDRRRARRVRRATTSARRRQVFIEYVMLAGVNDRYGQAVAARRAARPARLQGQPDPVQPDRRATTAPRAARSTPSAPRWRSTACARRSGSRAAATSTRPAVSSPRRPWPRRASRRPPRG